jgi:hypothetical protein
MPSGRRLQGARLKTWFWTLQKTLSIKTPPRPKPSDKPIVTAARPAPQYPAKAQGGGSSDGLPPTLRLSKCCQWRLGLRLSGCCFAARPAFLREIGSGGRIIRGDHRIVTRQPRLGRYSSGVRPRTDAIKGQTFILECFGFKDLPTPTHEMLAIVQTAAAPPTAERQAEVVKKNVLQFGKGASEAH